MPRGCGVQVPVAIRINSLCICLCDQSVRGGRALIKGNVMLFNQVVRRRLAAGVSAAGMGIVFSSAWAQSPLQVAMVDEVVVTATRVPEKRSTINQNVTVITAEDIARSGQQTLAELLQMQGGVAVTSSGMGQPVAVSIRGTQGGHTVVLVDGLRLGSATDGSVAFENIPLAQIERIEIVPGALSGLYGSGAIGGVIQIFTKSGLGTTAKIGIGTYGTREASYAFGRRVEDTEINFSIGTLESRGFNTTRPEIPFNQYKAGNEAYRNSNFSGRIVQHINSANEVGLTLFQSEGVTHLDLGPTTDDVNRQTLNAFSVYSRNRLTTQWSSLFRLGTTRDILATTGAFPGYFQTDQHQATWQNDIQFETGTLLAGMDYLAQRVASDSTQYTKNNRDTVSAFGGYHGAIGKNGFQVNGRRDDSNQYGLHNTGAIGYSYQFAPVIKVRASAGTAFRAPSFNDLYFPTNPGLQFIQNPNVRPERSRSREIGADLKFSNQTFAVTAFENKIADLITIYTDPVTFDSTTINLDNAKIKGYEFAYSGQWAEWQLQAKATIQDARNEANNQMLRRRANQFGSLVAKRRIGPWSIGAEATGSSYRYDSTTEAPASKMHGYGLVNLTAGYAVSKDWSINGRLNNIFDRQYELAQFYNTPRSNFFVWLAYQTK